MSPPLLHRAGLDVSMDPKFCAACASEKLVMTPSFREEVFREQTLACSAALLVTL